MSTEIDDALEIPTSRSRSRYVSFGGGFVDGMQGGMRLAKQVQAMYRQDEADKIAREKKRQQALTDERTGKGLDQTVPTVDPAAPVPAALPAQEARAMPVSNNLDAIEQRPLGAPIEVGQQKVATVEAVPSSPTSAPPPINPPVQAAPPQTAQSDVLAQSASPSEYADSWPNTPAAPDAGALAQNNFDGAMPAAPAMPAMEIPAMPLQPAVA